MFGSARHEVHRGCGKSRDPSLHVGRSATVEHTVADRPLEGGARPVFHGPGRHDVRVPGETEERPSAAVLGPEVAHGRMVEAPDPETLRLEGLGQEVLAAGVVGRDGRAAEECAGESDGGGIADRHVRRSSLIAVRSRVLASTLFTITAQASWQPPVEGSVPGTTTAYSGISP